jgi:hypothetical protein
MRELLAMENGFVEDIDWASPSMKAMILGLLPT